MLRYFNFLKNFLKEFSTHIELQEDFCRWIQEAKNIQRYLYIN